MSPTPIFPLNQTGLYFKKIVGCNPVTPSIINPTKRA